MERILEFKSDESTITIPIRLSLRGCRFYRTEFGRDLIADLAALYQAIEGEPQAKFLKELSAHQIDPENEIAVKAFLKENPEVMILIADRVLSFEETETGLRILWAFAKNHDDTLQQSAEDWGDSFDTVLPVRELILAIYGLWVAASAPTVALKNG